MECGGLLVRSSECLADDDDDDDHHHHRNAWRSGGQESRRVWIALHGITGRAVSVVVMI